MSSANPIPVGTMVRVRQDADSAYSGSAGTVVDVEASLGYQCVVQFGTGFGIQFLYRELDVIDPVVTDDMLDRAIKAYGPLRNEQSPSDHRTNMRAALKAALEES